MSIGRARTRLASATLLIACLLAASRSAAQPAGSPTGEDRALAQTLFEEGKELSAAGRWADACPKLEESHRLDPLPGVLLNLAVCHENVGRTATAWTELKESLALARADGREDREQLALDHLRAIEPRLARLTIEVDAAAAVPSLEVRRDDRPVARVAWGSAAPIDPGHHVVRAVAPDSEPWQTEIEIRESESISVRVPRLARAPARPTPPPPPRPAPPPADHTTRRNVGWILVGGGVLGVGVGAIFGVRAIVKENEAVRNGCTGSVCTGDRGLLASSSANEAATVANVCVGVGIVLAVGGAVLVLASPRAPARTAIRATPSGFVF